MKFSNVFQTTKRVVTVQLNCGRPYSGPWSVVKDKQKTVWGTRYPVLQKYIILKIRSFLKPALYISFSNGFQGELHCSILMLSSQGQWWLWHNCISKKGHRRSAKFVLYMELLVTNNNFSWLFHNLNLNRLQNWHPFGPTIWVVVGWRVSKIRTLQLLHFAGRVFRNEVW